MRGSAYVIEYKERTDDWRAHQITINLTPCEEKKEKKGLNGKSSKDSLAKPLRST